MSHCTRATRQERLRGYGEALTRWCPERATLFPNFTRPVRQRRAGAGYSLNIKRTHTVNKPTLAGRAGANAARRAKVGPPIQARRRARRWNTRHTTTAAFRRHPTTSFPVFVCRFRDNVHDTPNVHGPSIPPPQIYSTNFSVETRGSPVLCPRSHFNATLIKFAQAPLLIDSEQKRRGRYTNWYCCTDCRHPVSFYPKKARHKLVQPTEGVPSTPLLLGSESKNKKVQSRNLPPPAAQPSTYPQLTRASVAQTQSINGPYTSNKIGPRSKASN